MRISLGAAGDWSSCRGAGRPTGPQAGRTAPKITTRKTTLPTSAATGKTWEENWRVLGLPGGCIARQLGSDGFDGRLDGGARAADAGGFRASGLKMC